MTRANKQRGEVMIEGPGGEEYRLCLTLGAIAQIEDEISNLESLADIGSVMADKPRMSDLLTIFIALLNGGGHTEITKKDMMGWDLSLIQLSDGIQKAFKASGFGDDDDEEEDGDVSGK